MIYKSGGPECQENHLVVIGELCQALDNSTENVKVAIKVAEENMEDAIAAREQLLKQGEDSLATLRTVHEDLKKAMALNIDLAHKNAELELELNRARWDTLVLRAEAMVEKKAAIDKEVQSAKAKAAIDKEIQSAKE